MDDLESRIKGQTMTYIYDTFFAGKTKEQQEITAALNAFEPVSYTHLSAAQCDFPKRPICRENIRRRESGGKDRQLQSRERLYGERYL